MSKVLQFSFFVEVFRFSILRDLIRVIVGVYCVNFIFAATNYLLVRLLEIFANKVHFLSNSQCTYIYVKSKVMNPFQSLKRFFGLIIEIQVGKLKNRMIQTFCS